MNVFIRLLFFVLISLYLPVSFADPSTMNDFQLSTHAVGLSHTPEGIAVGPASPPFMRGDVFISHRGNANVVEDDYISRIDSLGSVSSFASLGAKDPGAIGFGKGPYAAHLFVTTNTTTLGLGDSQLLEIDSNGNVSVFANTGGSASGGIDFDTTGLYGSSIYLGVTGLDGIMEVNSSGIAIIPVFSLFPGPICGGPTALQFGLGNSFASSMYLAVDSCSPSITLSGVYTISPSGGISTLINTSTSPLVAKPGVDGMAFSEGGAFGEYLYLSDTINGTILRINASGTASVFASGLSAPKGIAFDGTDALYVLESGENRVIKIMPDIVPTISCVGFESPMASGPVIVKGDRALPLKIQLLSEANSIISAGDVVAAPVLRVHYQSLNDLNPIDVTSESLSAELATTGTQFQYADTKWKYNLKTVNFLTAGTYEITIVSGDETEYHISESCKATFVIK